MSLPTLWSRGRVSESERISLSPSHISAVTERADGGKRDAEKCVPRLWTKVQVSEGRRMASRRHAGRDHVHSSSSISRYSLKSPVPSLLALLSACFWSVFFAPLLFPRRGHTSRYISSPSLHTSFISSLLNASLFPSTLISPPPPSVSPLITTPPPHSCCLPSDAPSLLVTENERVLKPAAPLALLLQSSMLSAALSLSLSLSVSQPPLFFIILLFLSISVYLPPLACHFSFLPSHYRSLPGSVTVSCLDGAPVRSHTLLHRWLTSLMKCYLWEPPTYHGPPRNH